MSKWIKFLVPKVLWVLILALVIQYYLVFPGIFADLPSNFETEHPKVTVGLVNGTVDSPKYLHYNAEKDDADLVVFFHGNYETVDQSFRPIVHLTGKIDDVLLVEYPGYGDSPGWPTPDVIVDNTQAVIAKYRKPGQDLVVWGRSLGGGFAFELAARETPKALILESTFLHPINTFGPDFLTTVLSPFFFLDLNNEEKISSLPPSLPVLLLHGDQDDLFDVAVSHRMKSRMAHMPVKQVIYEGGHNARNYPLNTVMDFLSEIESPK